MYYFIVHCTKEPAGVWANFRNTHTNMKELCLLIVWYQLQRIWCEDGKNQVTHRILAKQLLPAEREPLTHSLTLLVPASFTAEFAGREADPRRRAVRVSQLSHLAHILLLPTPLARTPPPRRSSILHHSEMF